MGSYYIADLVVALMVAQKRGASHQALGHDHWLEFNRDLPSPMDMDTLRRCGFEQHDKEDRVWISPHEYKATD